MHAAVEFILEQIRGIWRFRWVAMLVAWVVCIGGWIVVLGLPDTYSAWARVYIDTRTRLSQATSGIAMESNIAAQAAAVRQAILGGPQLDKVARLALPGYATATPAQQNAIIEGLRARLQVESNGGEQRTAPADLYTISFTDPDRATAHRVVDQLLRLFLANSLGGSQEGAEQAQQFLVQQIADYEKRLQTAEGRLADFKRMNAGLVPGATGDYFTRLRAENDELEKERLALTLAEQKHNELQRQLSGEQPMLGGPGSAGGDTASAIRATQARLDELLLRFTDNYPDVINARRELEDLRKRQQAEIAAVRRGDPAAIASSGLASNPVYQGIRMQLSQVDVDVAAGQRQVAAQEAKIADLRKMINTAPGVEAQFAQLTRDYDITRGQYQMLADRLNRAKLSDKADANGVVRFQVVEPPTGNQAPVSPDRPRLIFVVLLAGLVAGAGVAYLLHQLRPVFTSPRQLGDMTQLPVLGMVSMTWLERHQARERRALWAYSMATGVLVLLAGLMLLTESVVAHLLHRVIA
ncbi:MAG TPA: XrtA system polysaccharide chain length determinant [Steroidobacteraceae bacterium]|jgi:polysaccharide chain length determinant protein (PEP-CTERM system associated)|nr:XrtA system polysaccharide chain length determinant [Steroidobacteraceae bacterium]